MIRAVRQYLEMIRFSHTVFAMPFAVLGAVMAWTTPLPLSADASPPPFRWQDLLGILVCMVAARSAAMAFNRIADRHVDAANPRTASRHLPSGKLSLRSVGAFTAACCIAFVAATLLFLPNHLPLYLSVPVLLFLLAYSYTKRFTWMAHFWLGTALMLAPVSAWIAIRGDVLPAFPIDLLPPLWLGLAVMLWVAGFDMIYACQDVEFDRRAKLHSVPARWGVQRALRLAALCHAGMILVLALLPALSWVGAASLSLGAPFGIALAAVAGLLVYEHWLVRPDDLTRVNVAFFHMNAIVSLGLCTIAAIDLLWS